MQKEKGTYIAKAGSNGACVIIDEYTVFDNGQGFTISSQNTVLGEYGFSQNAELFTDYNWTPKKMSVKVQNSDREFLGDINGDKVILKNIIKETVEEKVVPLINKNIMFLFSGAIVLPFIWLRSYDFNNYDRTQYQIIPHGTSEVQQLKGSANGSRTFNIQINIGGQIDMIRIETDNIGKMLSFESQTTKLIIKLN